MDVIAELKDLQQKAMIIAVDENKERRWGAGFWLERECETLNARHRILDGFNEAAKIELMAIISILFDIILADHIGDPDFAESIPTYDGDIDALVQGLLHELR